MSWSLVPLHDVCRPKQWKTIASSKLLDEGFPVYGANGIIGFYDEYTHELPTLMITCRGATCGNVHISKPKSYINGNAMALDSLDHDKVDIRYLYYFFKSRGFKDVISGSAQPQITGQGLTKVQIPLPPLGEQKRIAAILDKADAIRQKRKQAIDLADEFLRSVFLDMFGDPVTNPKGWEVKSLFELTKGKLQNGAYFPKDMYSGDGVEMVHMGDAFYDYIPRGKMKRVIANDKEIQKYKVTTDDILISRRSLNYEGAAKPSLIIDDKEPLLFESSLIRLTPNSDVLNKLYLFGYLSNEIVKEHKIRKFVTGATIKGISQKNLENIEILVPPIDLQTKYEGVVSGISKLKRKIENEDRLATLFSSLSQRAFSSEL
ncbi:restriction endonuclease subunit S [Vibrio sp. 10N.222.52.C3]|uniref:restriction endonuclease subunit S n=1 Tax=Vibrio sp. 10N.222.52.C3 TaxID=3229631 RepID=UPI00355034F3